MSKTVLTDNDICPDLVSEVIYGNHKSFVNRKATTRTWTFETETQAQKFQHDVEVNPNQFRRQQ